ncbi:helix-turn-helix transcriptional regulator [Luteimonas aquatica]|uniref:helix-turn-helix transcriptional regulator n=1 Tax=Luteimonas aquatica TaxID=450364 RepID=UPI001F59FC9D|nr:LuxR family transcriptional regulator [Luteimonas aquatica]
MQYGDHIQRVLAAGSMEALRRSTSDFAAALGFEHHGFAARLSRPATGRAGYHSFENYRNEWGDRYATLHRPEMARGDARVLHARTGMPAISWNTRGQFGYLPPTPALLRRARRQTRAAGDFGMSAGITVPSWSRGIDWAFVTFSTDATHDLAAIDRDIGAMVYFVNCLQATFDRLQDNRQSVRPLSVREREVLCWSAVGKTSWEISVILQLSERTVNFHLQQAARKLQVKGRRAACARAVALGLIAL